MGVRRSEPRTAKIRHYSSLAVMVPDSAGRFPVGRLGCPDDIDEGVTPICSQGLELRHTHSQGYQEHRSSCSSSKRTRVHTSPCRYSGAPAISTPKFALRAADSVIDRGSGGQEGNRVLAYHAHTTIEVPQASSTVHGPPAPKSDIQAALACFTRHWHCVLSDSHLGPLFHDRKSSESLMGSEVCRVVAELR